MSKAGAPADVSLLDEPSAEREIVHPCAGHIDGGAAPIRIRDPHNAAMEHSCNLMKQTFKDYTRMQMEREKNKDTREMSNE